MILSQCYYELSNTSPKTKLRSSHDKGIFIYFEFFGTSVSFFGTFVTFVQDIFGVFSFFRRLFVIFQPYIDRVLLNNLIIKTSSKQHSFLTWKTSPTKRLGTPKSKSSLWSQGKTRMCPQREHSHPLRRIYVLNLKSTALLKVRRSSDNVRVIIKNLCIRRSALMSFQWFRNLYISFIFLIYCVYGK